MSAAMTEFRITSDLSTLRQQLITANFDEVKGWLDENLAPYRNMVVGADAISEAKTYRANIRKVRDRIDSCRKEAKAAALAAYTDFETRCKELTGMCDDAAGAIDAQVKAFEEEERKEKIARLLQEYCDLADEDMRVYCPWESVLNEKWGNKGYKYEDAVEEIRAALFYAATNLQSIRDMGGEDTPYLLEIYKQTHDINAVLRKSLELKATREKEEIRKQLAEAEKEAAKREAAGETKTIKASEPDAMSKAKPGDTIVFDEPEDVITIDFRVTCTKTQLSALGEYMRRNGIKYGRVS